MGALLSKQFLQDIGVELDESTYEALSQHYETTLSERVIREIIDELNEDQLKELQTLQGGEPAAVPQWLATNVPQLSEIIEDEVAILLGEIAENNDAI